jgi:hypothetical protein
MLFCPVFAIKYPPETQTRRRSISPAAKSIANPAPTWRQTKQGRNVPSILQAAVVFRKLFRMNTCKSVSKQSTLTPFRMNTCEKTQGGGVSRKLTANHNSNSHRAACSHCPSGSTRGRRGGRRNKTPNPTCGSWACVRFVRWRLRPDRRSA